MREGRKKREGGETGREGREMERARERGKDCK